MPKAPSETGFTVDLTDLLRSGLQLGKFDKGVPFWKAVDGLQFTASSVRRKPGREFIVDLGTAPIRGIITLNEYDTKIAYIGDTGNLYSYRLDTDTVKTVGTGYSLAEMAGSTVWDSGSTTWDNGSTVWDEGTVQAAQWSFTRFGTWVIAADNTGPMKIKKGNVTFNDLSSTEVSGAVVNAGGSGYVVGDTVTHTGGSGTGFTSTITEVSAGVVTAFEITAYGTGFTDGNTLTQSTTSGIGTGFTLDVTVPDCLFTKVRAVASLGPHILAFNYDKATGESPYDFAWCSEDNPDNWVAAAANSAGSLTIREANTEIKAVVPLNSGLGVYTEDQLFLVSYIGAPFYFGYRVVMSSGVGAVSAKAVVSVDRKNYGLSRRGLFVTDGVNVQQLGVEEGIEEYIRDNISVSEYPQVHGYHNASDNEVVWYLPIADTRPNWEVYYNYTNGTLGSRTGTISSAAAYGVFDNSFSGDSEGNLYYEGLGYSEQSTSGTSRAHDLEQPNVIKEVSSIRVGKIGHGNPVIKVGWSDTINGTPVYTDTFTVNDTYAEVDLRTAGRYLFLNVTSSEPNDTWEITDMQVQGRTAGTR